MMRREWTQADAVDSTTLRSFTLNSIVEKPIDSCDNPGVNICYRWICDVYVIVVFLCPSDAK